jgi:hypothetical protein
MKSCRDSDDFDLGGVGQTFRELIDAQIGLGGEVLKLLGKGTSGAISGLGGLGFPASRSSCCDMPDPCWMPQCGGEAHCRLAEGGTGVIRITLTNDDRVSHAYSLQAAGFGAGLVSFSTPNITLGPKERTVIIATFTMPTGQAAPAVPYDVVVWVRGCREHYFRWIISTGHRGKACCHETAINDGPNNIVHWYDHFYCPRPCPTSTAPRQ